MPLVTAGSGIAIGLPANFGIAPSDAGQRAAAGGGLRARSFRAAARPATNRQVRAFIDGGGAGVSRRSAAHRRRRRRAAQALAWARPRLATGPVLVYSTADPARSSRVQRAARRRARPARWSKHALAAIARGLVERGVRQLVVAGGETSGACVQALGIAQLQIGPQIDPGVPWCHAQRSARRRAACIWR